MIFVAHNHFVNFMPHNSIVNSQTKAMVLHMVDSCVHGFHVYRNVWTLATGEVLFCEREDGNPMDLYAVAIKKGTEAIGNVP